MMTHSSTFVLQPVQWRSPPWLAASIDRLRMLHRYFLRSIVVRDSLNSGCLCYLIGLKGLCAELNPTVRAWRAVVECNGGVVELRVWHVHVYDRWTMLSICRTLRLICALRCLRWRSRYVGLIFLLYRRLLTVCTRLRLLSLLRSSPSEFRQLIRPCHYIFN